MKINPFLYQHVNLAEKIMDKAVSAEPKEESEVADTVELSAEAQKKRVMGAVIKRIANDDD